MINLQATAQDQIVMEIPARAEYVSLVRLVVGSLAASRRDLDDERVADLRLAVSEACTNAIESYGPEGPGSQDRVTITWRDETDHLAVVIEDRGSGFDPEGLSRHPPVTDPARLNYERGLGIPLIRELVDVVSIEPSPLGTTVTLSLICRPSGRGARP
ncbi:MAG: ATP-binding protein [Acidimicrobiales bacterium]